MTWSSVIIVVVLSQPFGVNDGNIRHRFTGRLFHHFFVERSQHAVLRMADRDEQVRIILRKIYGVDRVVRGPVLGLFFGRGRLVGDEVGFASELDELHFLRSEPFLNLSDRIPHAFKLERLQV